MGPCMSSYPKNQQKDETVDFSKPPKDIQNYFDKNLPQLSFKGSLSNIKLKNVDNSSFSINFDIQKIKNIDLQQKKSTSEGNIKWNIKENFTFKANSFQLRNRSINIKVFEPKSMQQIGRLKINLYLVATGPYHHDFLIGLRNRKDARIAFDLKISQQVKVKAEPFEVQLDNHGYVGDMFAFTVKTIIGNSTWTSSPSFVLEIGLLDQKQQANHEIEAKKNQKLKNKISIVDFQKTISPNQQLIWKKQQCLDMPQFEAEFPFDQFASASFQIIFWVLNQTNKSQKIYAASTFSFNKLIYGKQQKQQIGNLIYQTYQVNLQQSLKATDKQLGKCRLLIKFKMQQHIKQMQVCVRTQEGIQSRSPIYTDGVSSNEQLVQLVKINDEIDQQITKLQNSQNSTTGKIEIRKIADAAMKNFQKSLKLLKATYKQSTVMYRYSTQAQLKQAIEVLLDVGQKVLQFLRQQNQDIRNLCWAVLIAIMKRGQLTLNYIGFDSKQMMQIEKNQMKPSLIQKIKIAEKYQHFLYKLLQRALKALTIKGYQMQQNFAQKFCAYAYFRIPKFRNQILTAILHKDDPQITQWRGTQFHLNEDLDFNQLKQNSQNFKMLFDWGNNFYKAIQNEEKSKDNKQKLNNMLNEPKWKQRLQKRGGAYSSFIKYWIEYIQELTVKTKDMKWNYFPGYNKIIQSFLVLLKITPVQKVSIHMKQAASKLLTNQKLLSIFITITLNKVNVYSPTQVIKSLQLIVVFLNSLRQRSIFIPSNFNYIFFFKAFKIIIQSNFAFGIAKALQVFYQYFDLFSIQFQINISMYLLGKVFFRFFLHWSYNIRLIFYHLLTFRIYHQSNKLQTENQQNINNLKLNYIKDVKPRYQKLMLMLENGQRMRLQQNRKMFSSNYQKELFKKMKRKINEKKKLLSAQVQNQGNKKDFIKLQRSNKSHSIPRIINKYNLEELSKPKLERYNSEIMKVSILAAIKDRTAQKQNGQIGDAILNRQQTKVSYKQNQKKTRKLSTMDIQDYQIVQPTPSQISYLIVAMQQYLKINEGYLKILKDKNLSIPRVKLQIPVDETQYRPEGADQW